MKAEDIEKYLSQMGEEPWIALGNFRNAWYGYAAAIASIKTSMKSGTRPVEGDGLGKRPA